MHKSFLALGPQDSCNNPNQSVVHKTREISAVAAAMRASCALRRDFAKKIGSVMAGNMNNCIVRSRLHTVPLMSYIDHCVWQKSLQ